MYQKDYHDRSTPLFRRRDEATKRAGGVGVQDDDSSDGSLQTACSDLGPGSPSMSVDTPCMETFPTLLHTHSGAHSSAGLLHT